MLGELIPELARNGLKGLIEIGVVTVFAADRHERTHERSCNTNLMKWGNKQNMCRPSLVSICRNNEAITRLVGVVMLEEDKGGKL